MRGARIRVGLEHPFDPRLVIGVSQPAGPGPVRVGGQQARLGRRASPRARCPDGRPGRDVVATWVVADETATADGLATALFFTGRTIWRRCSGSRTCGCSPMAASRSPELRRRALHVAPPPTAVGRTRPTGCARARRGLARKGRMTALSKRIRVTMLAGISVSLVMAPCGPTGLAVVRPTAGSDAGATRSRSTIRDAAYADGVYTATGQYGSLPSSITVTATLVDDVITAVEVTPHATDPTSLDLQRRFAEAVPAVVVGNPIDEVDVDRLAGSSGTPTGSTRRSNRSRNRPGWGGPPRNDAISRQEVAQRPRSVYSGLGRCGFSRRAGHVCANKLDCQVGLTPTASARAAPVHRAASRPEPPVAHGAQRADP